MICYAGVKSTCSFANGDAVGFQETDFPIVRKPYGCLSLIFTVANSWRFWLRREKAQRTDVEKYYIA